MQVINKQGMGTSPHLIWHSSVCMYKCCLSSHALWNWTQFGWGGRVSCFSTSSNFCRLWVNVRGKDHTCCKAQSRSQTSSMRVWKWDCAKYYVRGYSCSEIQSLHCDGSMYESFFSFFLKCPFGWSFGWLTDRRKQPVPNPTTTHTHMQDNQESVPLYTLWYIYPNWHTSPILHCRLWYTVIYWYCGILWYIL